MFCSREYQHTSILLQQNEKSTPTTDNFEEIKHRLIKPPHLYSDMSKFATGSAVYQIQNGKPKLIAYASKGYQKLQGITL